MRKSKTPVDKIEHARATGEYALATFRDAHSDLTRSVEVLRVAEQEHLDAARAAEARAAEAKALAERHTKAAEKIAELLGQ